MTIPSLRRIVATIAASLAVLPLASTAAAADCTDCTPAETVVWAANHSWY